jgi:hypothetical protein
MDCLVFETVPSGNCIKFPGSNCAENEFGGGKFFVNGTAFPPSSNTSWGLDFAFAREKAPRNAEERESGATDAATVGL